MNKPLRITLLIVVIAAVLGAIIASVSIKPSNFDQVWDPATTLGSPNASNYFVVYSDLACPYCLAFENAIIEHEEDFQKYLENNDVLFEVRLSDYLYEFGESNPVSSLHGALASYCAKNEGKFWDYYNHAVSTVWNDFFKDNGKAGAADLIKQNKSYWINLGTDVGLGDSFADCVNSEATLAEVQEAAQKSVKTAQGMPYIKLNKYTSPGFDLNGDWNDVLNLFQLGLESK